ncbi:hypothetical protein BDV32DRAFT_104894 [Aspergillus pseudonomiae]|nr:hypothetical protein BDV32DRAFT_104894 [Aspergillus pseudonomiae]
MQRQESTNKATVMDTPHVMLHGSPWSWFLFPFFFLIFPSPFSFWSGPAVIQTGETFASPFCCFICRLHHLHDRGLRLTHSGRALTPPSHLGSLF